MDKIDITIVFAIYGAVMTLLTVLLAFKSSNRDNTQDVHAAGVADGQLKSDIAYIKDAVNGIKKDTTKTAETLGKFNVMFAKMAAYIREIYTRLDAVDNKGVPEIEL